MLTKLNSFGNLNTTCSREGKYFFGKPPKSVTLSLNADWHFALGARNYAAVPTMTASLHDI